MRPALREHLQEMLSQFAREIAKREPPGVRRTMALYACVRKAHQRAREEPEKRFWAHYLKQIELKADQLRRELERRRVS